MVDRVARRQLEAVRTGLERVVPPVPMECAGEAGRKAETCTYRFGAYLVFHGDHSEGRGFGDRDMMKRAERGVDVHRGEVGCGGRDAGHGREKIDVWMGTPGMRV